MSHEPANLDTFQFDQALSYLLADQGADPFDDTPIGRATAEFFKNNWRRAQAGLLARTDLIKVVPPLSAAPRVFAFGMGVSYKRKSSSHAPAKIAPGPIRGMIYYRPDILCPADAGPPVAVSLHDRGILHPNYSRRHGLLCVGEWPAGQLVELDALLEHVYRIVTYQNLRVTHPADVEAAEYFATDPDAMRGLEHVQPLY
jgi:hypothetical protein